MLPVNEIILYVNEEDQILNDCFGAHLGFTVGVYQLSCGNSM